MEYTHKILQKLNELSRRVVGLEDHIDNIYDELGYLFSDEEDETEEAVNDADKTTEELAGELFEEE